MLGTIAIAIAQVALEQFFVPTFSSDFRLRCAVLRTKLWAMGDPASWVHLALQ
jgi:hypothetical protein